MSYVDVTQTVIEDVVNNDIETTDNIATDVNNDVVKDVVRIAKKRRK